MVDQGTLKQGCEITPVSANQQYPIDASKINSLGRQVESRMRSSGSIVFTAQEKPLERAPAPEPNNNLGPAQYFLQLTHHGGLPAHREQKGIKFRQDPELPEGISRRSLPIVDQGTVKQGVYITPVSSNQQYPIDASKINSLGRQVESRMRSSGSILFRAQEKPLERAPAPEPNNNLGPAQYLLQLTHTGGLPAHREPKGIKFRQDPELPEGISRRSLPVVDQGTLKQGQPISSVDQYQQYPVKGFDSMGIPNPNSRYRSAGSVTMSRRQNSQGRAPPMSTADNNGPAQFNLSRSMSTGLLDRGKAPDPKVVTKAEAIKKGTALFKLSLPKNASIVDWLIENGKKDHKTKLYKGNGKLPRAYELTHDGQPTTAKKHTRSKAKNPDTDDDKDFGKKKKSAVDEINSIQDWLAKNGGLPDKKNIFMAEFERRDAEKNRGHVKPTFMSVIPKYKY